LNISYIIKVKLFSLIFIPELTNIVISIHPRESWILYFPFF